MEYDNVPLSQEYMSALYAWIRSDLRSALIANLRTHTRMYTHTHTRNGNAELLNTDGRTSNALAWRRSGSIALMALYSQAVLSISQIVASQRSHKAKHWLDVGVPGLTLLFGFPHHHRPYRLYTLLTSYAERSRTSKEPLLRSYVKPTTYDFAT